MIYDRLDLTNGTTLNETHFKHIEDGIERASLPLVSCGIQNLCNPSDFKSGYNQYNTPSTGWGKVNANTAYIVIFPDVKLNSGEIITFWTREGNAIQARFISAFDDKKEKNVSYSVQNVQMYTVPEGVSYIGVTFSSSYATNNICIQKSTKSTWQGYAEPLKEIIKIDPAYLEGVNLDKNNTPVLHVYLPSELCIPQGYTIELYNRQACLEWERYHIQWIGKYGTAFERKYSITAGEDQEPETFTLTLNVLNDKLEILETRTCTCHIVSKDITKDQVIIPIGDSLTNNKYWMKHLIDASEQKIIFRGTRGHKDPMYSISANNHEGRSGAGTGWYNLGTSNYTFDSSGVSTLTSSGSYDYMVDTSGNPISPLACNPFWHRTQDGSVDKFDFDFYCNSKADGGAGIFQDVSGNAESITPTGVIIYLGANGISLDGSKAATNIKTLITLIRGSVKGASIPIYVVNDAFRAPYIAYTNADGFNTNVNGEYGYLNDLKHINLETALYEEMKDMDNVFFMPICATFDSEHNYPYTEIGINPYSDTPKMRKYSDTQHPQNSASAGGYKQMAATMLGVILKHSQN